MPAQVLQNIVACQRELARETGRDVVRWTPGEQIHLTMKFLGNVTARQIDALQSALPGIPQRFRLAAHGVGAFPSRRNPRVVWIGLAGDLDALKAMHAAIDKLATRKEERDFHPHLTIGRVRENQRFPANLERWRDQRFGEWEAGELLLMQSKLSPNGAAHTVIARFVAP